MNITHKWSTEEPHFDNTETMGDYLNVEMDQTWEVLEQDGNYAIVQDYDQGNKYAVTTCGNGDSYNHLAELTLID